MQHVRYTTRWNPLKRQPTLGHSWVSPEQARALYESGEGVEVVDPAVSEDGSPRPLWVIGASVGFRVQLFTPGGSVARIVDWAPVDGRLWRESTSEYLYPDDDHHYRMAEAVTMVRIATRSDGTATLMVRDGSKETHVTEFADVATDAFWLDVPEFGDWGPLVEATLGAAPTPPA